MREQQRRIFEAVLMAISEKGSLMLSAEFLTLEELMRAATRVNESLEMDVQLNRNTLQAWMKQGILREKADRTTRNRLYSGIDLIRLVTVSQLTRVGLKVRAAADIADQVIGSLETDWFLDIHSVIETTDASFDPRYFVWFTPEGKQLQIWSPEGLRKSERPEALAQFGARTRPRCFTGLFNAALVASVCIAVLGEAHQAKLPAAMRWADAKFRRGDKDNV